jgi:sarcosine oxidase gamma subunit
MADALGIPLGIAGFSVEIDEATAVGALRYFDAQGEFAQAVRRFCAIPLPRTQEALQAKAAGLILAWRSPTEIWVLGTGERRLQGLSAAIHGARDGCLVDLTGGLKVVRLRGERIGEVLRRLGSAASVPACGEARRSRMADLAVLALSVRSAETLLVLDRALVPHLLAWMKETVLDFAT